jgi:MraZ protein
MSQFLGTHLNRLDAKGRVSVPAPFRNALKSSEGTVGLILRPSHKHACIEGWPLPVFNALSAPLERMDVFSDGYDDMATALYADAYPIEPDKEGRVLLPDSLVAHAGLGETVEFVGHGRTFQIWEPAAAAEHRKAARERARLRGAAPAQMAPAPGAPA